MMIYPLRKVKKRAQSGKPPAPTSQRFQTSLDTLY